MSRKEVLMKMSSAICQELAFFNGVSQRDFNNFFSFYEEGNIAVAVSQYSKFDNLIEEKRQGMGERLDDFLRRKDIVPVVYFFKTWDGDSCEILEEIVSIVKREIEKNRKVLSCQFGQCLNCHRLACVVREMFPGQNYLCPGCFQKCQICMGKNCKDEEKICPKGISLF